MLSLSLPQATQKQTEKHAPQLKAVEELAEALKAVLRGQESLVDDKVQLLNCNWVAVTSRSEEWLKLLLVGLSVSVSLCLCVSRSLSL